MANTHRHTHTHDQVLEEGLRNRLSDYGASGKAIPEGVSKRQMRSVTPTKLFALIHIRA